MRIECPRLEAERTARPDRWAAPARGVLARRRAVDGAVRAGGAAVGRRRAAAPVGLAGGRVGVHRAVPAAAGVGAFPRRRTVVGARGSAGGSGRVARAIGGPRRANCRRTHRAATRRLGRRRRRGRGAAGPGAVRRVDLGTGSASGRAKGRCGPGWRSVALRGWERWRGSSHSGCSRRPGAARGSLSRSWCCRVAARSWSGRPSTGPDCRWWRCRQTCRASVSRRSPKTSSCLP